MTTDPHISAAFAALIAVFDRLQDEGPARPLVVAAANDARKALAILPTPEAL